MTIPSLQKVNSGNLTIDSAGGTTTINDDLVVTGNLTISGTTAIINATTITVDDKNIELGSVESPDNATANGGGITLKGATDKTIIWDSANTNWTSSEHWNLATGKEYKINNNLSLNSTTLRLYGSSTGYSNIVSANTKVNNYTLTLPAITGTLATLAGTETFTNKTLTSPIVNTSLKNGTDSFDLINEAIAAGTLGSPKTVSINISKGTIGDHVTKNINIGGSQLGETSSIENINIGSKTSNVYIPGTLKNRRKY